MQNGYAGATNKIEIEEYDNDNDSTYSENSYDSS